jgi:magnesium transporter
LAFVSERGVPASYYLTPTGAVERNLTPKRLVEALKEGGQLWVDIDATDRAQHALLEKVFGFHQLSIEDTLSPKTRVKLEEYGGYLFLVIREVRFDHKTEDPYDLETFNLYCFLGANYFVTVHSLPARAVDVVKDRIERSPDLLSRGVEMIAHGVMDTVVDEFLPLVDQVDDMVTKLEEQLFERYDEKAITDIFQVKRLVVQLRRYLGPLREVLNVLTNRPHACIKSSAQVYFRDVYDHTIRIVESLESVRDLVSTVLDTYLTQSSNRLNKVMKSLSVVGTISLPLVVVGGMFGMNLHGIPFAQSPWGFTLGVALQLVLAAILYIYIRRRGWT